VVSFFRAWTHRAGVTSVGRDAGQLHHMAFGNTSLHDDVMLHDLELSRDFAAWFGGPPHGVPERCSRTGATDYAFGAEF
jgi:ribulose-bisphosphate carboxylase large chain